MGLHPKLKPFAAEKHIRRFNWVLKKVLKDLRPAKPVEWDVEVLRIKETSIWRRLYTTDSAGEVEQVIVVKGNGGGTRFTFANPMALGILHPYTLIIDLQAPAIGAYSMRRGLLGLGAKWHCESGEAAHLASIKALRLPGVNFNHSWGGWNFEVPVGMEIAPSEDDPSVTSWTIRSGYQGFLFGVGPRLAKYIREAPRLESLLKELAG
ncbi:MAG: hypothetical protein ACYSU0_14675 [Planctomycetota bacterium]|jgi:hypothetical protein